MLSLPALKHAASVFHVPRRVQPQRCRWFEIAALQRACRLRYGVLATMTPSNRMLVFSPKTFALAATILLAATVIGTMAALAQPGQRAAGRRLAVELCGDCHQAQPQFPTLHQYPPSFGDIAKLPSTTRLSLKVFLQSNHRQMPNFIVSKSNADDIIEYILSLKRQ